MKNYLKSIISRVKLKKAHIKCLKSKSRFPNIHWRTQIRNDGKIVINGFIHTGDGVIIRNNSGGELVFNEGIYLRAYSRITNSSGVMEIGANTTINDHCILQSSMGGLTIGSNVRIAPYVKIYAENHRFEDQNKAIALQGKTSSGITIGSNVWIGNSAIILDGVTIGDNVVIGAGSVVTKSIPEKSVAVGNPARVVKSLN